MIAGLLIAAPRSGSGKTILTLGLMRAFARRGRRVAGCKNGPDYIDPAFHAAATGRASLNLDSWAMPNAAILALAAEACRDADLLLCEGSMGLFDGVAAEPRRTGASADLAARLGLPVLLIVDISGQSQTAAAIVKGCDALDPEVRVAGVVLNRVASPRHERLARAAIEAAGYAVVGALPRAPDLTLPERHLGLVQAEEVPRLDAMLKAFADFVGAHVDLDAVAAIAEGRRAVARSAEASAPVLPPPGQRIALARDAAFSFLYPHVLAAWRAAGAEIRPFSPLADEAPAADCDICWLPGGYPELHAGRLASATHFLDGLRRFAETHPVHGECGGYMVLGQSLTAADGTVHPMAGLLAASFSFAKRKLALGYRVARLAGDHGLGPAGTVWKGHEFHYASAEPGEPADAPFAVVEDAQGLPQPGGSRRGSVSGSFFHLVARG